MQALPMSKIGLAIASIITATMTAPMLKADIMISTEGSPNGSVAPWGTPDSGATPTYGQLFVDPAGNPILKSVEFLISNGNSSGIPFKAYVYSWNGTNITGPALFTSGTLSVAPTGSSTTFDPVDINNMNVLLTPGDEYVALFSTVGFTGPVDSSAWDLATQASYSSGQFEYNNSTTLPPTLSWNNLGNFGNLAFTMNFGPSTPPAVPEPTSVVLLGTVVVMVWRVAHKRHSSGS